MVGLGLLIDRSNEAVAATRKRFNKLGIISGIAQSLTQAIDGSVQAVLEIHKCFRVPESQPEFFTGH